MISRVTAMAALVLLAAACTGPPPPKMIDAFANLYPNSPASAVPTDAPVSIQAPVGLMFSENFEAHIGAVRDANEYWGKVVPASLTNTVVIADTDPLYVSGKVLQLLQRRFPGAMPVHDFNEAVQKGLRGVILVDLRMKYMEPYGDRTQKMDIDLYFFTAGMRPVSRLNGHGEYKVPYASMDAGMQRLVNQAIGELEGKMATLVR